MRGQSLPSPEEEEPAATDVRHLLQERRVTIYLSAINFGEICCTVARRRSSMP